MSSHYKFEVHVKTPGEQDDEGAVVERFARQVADLAASTWLPPHQKPDFEVTVSEVQRN